MTTTDTLELDFATIRAAFVAALEHKAVPIADHLVDEYVRFRIRALRSFRKTTIKRVTLDAWVDGYCDANRHVDPRLDRWGGCR